MKKYLLIVTMCLAPLLLTACYGDMGGSRLSIEDAIQSCRDAGGKVGPGDVYFGVSRGALPQFDSITTSIRCDLTGAKP